MPTGFFFFGWGEFGGAVAGRKGGCLRCFFLVVRGGKSTCRQIFAVHELQFEQGSLDYIPIYHFWGIKQYKSMVNLRDFPLIAYCLGW